MLGSVDPAAVMMEEGLLPPSTPSDELALHLVLDDELTDLKDKALRCQASQVGPLLAQVDAAEFRDLNRYEMFRVPTEADWPDA
jgi:hypothetical protein